MAENYDAKAPVMASRWHEITPTKRSSFEEGVAKVLGEPPEKIKRGDDWEDAIKRVTTKDFESAVKGKGEKLAKAYKTAMLTD